MSRGSVIKRGDRYSVVLDHGEQRCMQCADCRSRHWTLDLGACPDCGGQLERTRARRREWHSGYDSKAEAEKARTALLKTMDDGTYTAPSTDTVQAWLGEWLRIKKPKGSGGRRHRGQVAISTWETYEHTVDRYLVPRLGDVKLQELTPDHIDRLYDHLETSGGQSGQGLAPKTVSNIHGVLRKALEDAVRRRKVAHNVADLVDAPSADSKEPEAWTVDELRRFLGYVEEHDPRLYAMWLLFSTTGARRGEIVGLTWDDLDLEAGTLTIGWTLGVAGGGKATWKPRPKTDAGERTMALDPATVEALKTWKAQQNRERLAFGEAWAGSYEDWRGNHRDRLAFTQKDGTVYHPENISKTFRQHCADASLRRIRLHDLRHTYATAGLSSATGWHEVKIISKRLGHASVGITIDTYSHALPEDDRQLADTLARTILGEQATGS